MVEATPKKKNDPKDEDFIVKYERSNFQMVEG